MAFAFLPIFTAATRLSSPGLTGRSSKRAASVLIQLPFPSMTPGLLDARFRGHDTFMHDFQFG
jgi:hypothetical protein